MSDRVITLPAFSQNEETLAGEMPLADLARLRGLLADAASVPAGALAYRLTGGADAEGCLFLTVTLSARLPLICQRCLEEFQYSLTATHRYWLRGGAAPANESECEELERGAPRLTDFLTDELLLALPVAPAHTRAVCKAATLVSA